MSAQADDRTSKDLDLNPGAAARYAVTALLAAVLLLAPIYAALPDDPTQIASFEWTSFLCAGAFLALGLAVGAARRGGVFVVRPSRVEAALGAVMGLAFLSLLWRLTVQHGLGFFGPMMRGWTVWAADFTLLALARRVAADRACLYALVFAAAAGAAVAADLGVQEHVAHLRAGDPSARTFGTSTPDFLAGYFVQALPVTLALFLQASALRGLSPLLRGLSCLVLGLILLFELVTLLTTQSRFALASLAVALVVFAVSLAAAVRRGLVLGRLTRLLLGVLIAALVLGGAVFARPVLSRLHNLHDNSAAFRVWTWRGGLHMAAANPLLGTGVGTWSDLYPRYALTGFTRLAHESYLQMADECGLPALLALLAALGLLGAALRYGLAHTPPGDGRSRLLPRDNRLLLCGLGAALAGGAAQNLIDSDWYVFFLGTTFWTLAGLAAGIAEGPHPEASFHPLLVKERVAEERSAVRFPSGPLTLALVAVGAVAAALLALTVSQGIAAGFALAAQGRVAADPSGAAQSLDAARLWDPLNGRYPSAEGYRVLYARSGDLLRAEGLLRAAAALEPNTDNFRHLGQVLQVEGDKAGAIRAYQRGLAADPNSLELLLALARLSPAPASLDYFRRLSALELTPVGTVRALGESVEPAFAYGDAAVGDASAGTDPAQAVAEYARAARLLESYAGEGGSRNEQRAVMNGGHPDAGLDRDLGALYRHILGAWIRIAPGEQQGALRRRQEKNVGKFAAVVRDDLKPGML